MPEWVTGWGANSTGRAICAKRRSPRAISGFRHFDVDTIEAGCLPDNAASLAVLRSLGMVQTGERVVFAPARQRDERVLYFAVRRDATGLILGS